MRDLVIVLPLVALLSPAPSPADVLASPEPAAAAKPAAATRSVTGTVVDTSGAVVPGATVALQPSAGAERTTQSDEAGRFVFDNVGPGPARVTAQVALFTPATMELDGPRSDLRLVLAPLPYTDQVTVQAPSLVVSRVTSATRTDTLLRDVPQSVTVVTRDLIARPDDAGHRPTSCATCRASAWRRAKAIATRRSSAATAPPPTSSSTASATTCSTSATSTTSSASRRSRARTRMIFGRGGVGGVINRVTRQADWAAVARVALQAGSFGRTAGIDRRLRAGAQRQRWRCGRPACTRTPTATATAWASSATA